MYIGSDAVRKVFLGGTAVSKVYRGGTQIFPNDDGGDPEVRDNVALTYSFAAASLTLTLEEVQTGGDYQPHTWTGKTRMLDLYSYQDCETCGGTGAVDQYDEPCPQCDGTGSTAEEEVECWECGGSGTIDGETCDLCGGSGVVTEITPCEMCGGIGAIQTTVCPDCEGSGHRKIRYKEVSDNA